MQALISAITVIVSSEAPEEAPFRPGDQVRLVGPLPESLAEMDDHELREIKFVVRYTGRGPMVAIQTDLAEDYWIATVPAANLEPFDR